MSTITYEVWEFFGRGDPFFGGSADDRVLYETADGGLAFLRGYEAHGLQRRRFHTVLAALAIGRALARPGAKLSAVKFTMPA